MVSRRLVVFGLGSLALGGCGAAKIAAHAGCAYKATFTTPEFISIRGPLHVTDAYVDNGRGRFAFDMTRFGDVERSVRRMSNGHLFSRTRGNIRYNVFVEYNAPYTLTPFQMTQDYVWRARVGSFVRTADKNGHELPCSLNAKTVRAELEQLMEDAVLNPQIRTTILANHELTSHSDIPLNIGGI